MRRNTVILAAFAVLAYAASATRAQEIVQTGACGGPTCGHQDCAPETCKHCVVGTEKKKITKVVYGSKCIDFCLAKCVRGCGKLQRHCKDHGCCHDNCPPPAAPECADCQQCGKVRTRRVLLKKTIDCGEEDVVKCSVVETPAVCCGSACGGTIIVPSNEPIAPPKTPGKTMPPATGSLGVPLAPAILTPAELATQTSIALPPSSVTTIVPLQP